MTAPAPPERVRELILQAACRRLSNDGVAALQARVIAADVGVSTTALYTHFHSIGGLLAAVNEVSYRRVGAAITSAGVTDDSLADIVAMGVAYRNFALANPHEYQLMFNHRVVRISRGARPADEAALRRPLETVEGRKAFGHLLRYATRLVESGLTRPLDARLVGTGCWSALHGFVPLEILGHFGILGLAAAEGGPSLFEALAVQIFEGLGIPIERVRESLPIALARVPAAASPNPS